MICSVLSLSAPHRGAGTRGADHLAREQHIVHRNRFAEEIDAAA
jgi:hypothetical protein